MWRKDQKLHMHILESYAYAHAHSFQLTWKFMWKYTFIFSLKIISFDLLWIFAY